MFHLNVFRAETSLILWRHCLGSFTERMSSRNTLVVVVERHDTELVPVIIDEPDGNSVVGKKWNQNQSDLTTASRYCQ